MHCHNNFCSRVSGFLKSCIFIEAMLLENKTPSTLYGMCTVQVKQFSGLSSTEEKLYTAGQKLP